LFTSHCYHEHLNSLPLTLINTVRWHQCCTAHT